MAVVVYVPSRLGEGFFTDLPAPTAGDDAKAITYDHGTGAFVYAAAAGGGTPPGSDTQLIFNDGGVYGADAGMTYDAANDRLTVAGGLVASSMRPASDSTTALQWQNAAGAAFVYGDSTNQRVGIGAASPTDSLSVNGSLRSYGTIPHLTTNSGAYIGFVGSAPTLLLANGTAAENVRLDQVSGEFRIVINTAVPFSISQAGITTITNLSLSSIMYATGFGFTVSSLTGMFISGGNTLNITGQTAAGYDILKLNPGEVTAMTLLKSGNVGFGTSSPTAIADLAASTAARASLHVGAGTKPTDPNDGDMWNDGNAYAMRVNGTNAVNTDGGLSIWMQSSTTARNVGRVLWQYTDKTDATRASRGSVTAFYTTTEHKPVTWGADSGGALLSFYDVTTPIARQVLATGAGATVDNVISALQALGLVKQS